MNGSDWVKFSQRRSGRGFTLIETLVSMSVASILAVLSMGGFQRARINAERTACASNLRQIGMGLIAFAGDHDGQFPLSGGVIPYGSVDPNTGCAGWTEQLEPYMGGKGREVYRCPDSSKRFASSAKYSYFQGTHAAYIAASGQGGTGFGAVRQSLIQFPDITIMGGDIASNAFTVDDADKDDYTQAPAFPGGTIPIHGGESNILFYDGHVAAFKSFDRQTMAVQYDGPTDTDSVYR